MKYASMSFSSVIKQKIKQNSHQKKLDYPADTAICGNTKYQDSSADGKACMAGSNGLIYIYIYIYIY